LDSCGYRVIGPVVLDEGEVSLHADIADPAVSGELVIEIPLTEAGTAKKVRVKEEYTSVRCCFQQFSSTATDSLS
jgi:hypothetical protein